jgi:hypothetical protein
MATVRKHIPWNCERCHKDRAGLLRCNECERYVCQICAVTPVLCVDCKLKQEEGQEGKDSN